MEIWSSINHWKLVTRVRVLTNAYFYSNTSIFGDCEYYCYFWCSGSGRGWHFAPGVGDGAGVVPEGGHPREAHRKFLVFRNGGTRVHLRQRVPGHLQNLRQLPAGAGPHPGEVPGAAQPQQQRRQSGAPQGRALEVSWVCGCYQTGFSFVYCVHLYFYYYYINRRIFRCRFQIYPLSF